MERRYGSRLGSTLSGSKKILDAELDEPGSDGRLSDDAEAGGAEGGSGVGELRVVQGVIELDAEGEFGIFSETADPARLPSEKSVLT